MSHSLTLFRFGCHVGGKQTAQTCFQPTQQVRCSTQICMGRFDFSEAERYTVHSQTVNRALMCFFLVVAGSKHKRLNVVNTWI